MVEGSSLHDVAMRTDESFDDVVRWHAAGLLDGCPSFAVELELVRLIGALERHGVSLDEIGHTLRDHRDVVEEFTKQLTTAEPASIASAAELADDDLPADTLDRVIRAGGLAETLVAPTVDDVVTLQNIKAIVRSGFPIDALVQIMRVYSDAMDRIADAETRLFHLHVHQALRESGLGGADLARLRDSVGLRLEQLIEPTLVYFHRKAWQRALRYDFVIHMLEELGVEVADSVHGQLLRAVLFVDLSSFTPLTAAMGDVTAAEILERFSVAVREIARAHDGTLVKQIGDGFLLVFLDVVPAVRAAEALNQRLSTEPQFPAMHSGIHYGPVLYREGDYVGKTVNIAARVLAAADRHETVLTEPARRRAGELSDVAFHPIGTRSFKGVDESFELYRVEGAMRVVDDRQADPVCGMQLRPNEVAASMTVGDQEQVFCSARCLGIFARRTPSNAWRTEEA